LLSVLACREAASQASACFRGEEWLVYVLHFLHDLRIVFFKNLLRPRKHAGFLNYEKQHGRAVVVGHTCVPASAMPGNDVHNREVGSFGCLLLVLVYDHWQDQQGWEKSTRLLAEEVMPRLADLAGA
jgi:hypothetical protein